MKSPLCPQSLAAWGLFVSALANGAQVFPDCTKGPLSNNTVCNTTASPAARAAALVAAMTIDEKLANLVDKSPGAERLGLPKYEWWSEALHGVALSPGVTFNSSGGAFSSATSFANPITLSAAFDDELVYQVASVISTEARAFSNAELAGLDYWTPNINPYKDPRWGRGLETPGEDPFRIKGYVRALLAGLEGPEETRRVIATCKHYAAYDLERWEGVVRYGFDAVVSMQDLVEYYLPPFQQCARDSNVGSFMCSYNSVNGTPACASEYLMQTVLREHWNWTGHNQYVTSDCNAIENIYVEHAWVETNAQAAGRAYTAGTDTVCEYSSVTDVQGAYNQALLTEETIDTSLKRLYEGLVRAGYFDPPTAPYRSLGWSDVNTPEAQALALQSAADGLVLKKNDGTLPLDLQNKSIALIGHWAEDGEKLLGNYNGIPPFARTPLAAARALGLTTHFAPGPVAQDRTADNWTEAALAAAARADVVLYFGGTDLSIEREDLDRTSIAWPDAQLELVSALCALGKPCVVVQLGDQNDDTPLLASANVSAVLWAGFPGQDGGTAVLDALRGASAPAGRLPVTQYPAAYVDAVPMTDMGLRPVAGDGAAKNPGRTYMWYDGAVLPFGHGLHYTAFDARFAIEGLVPTYPLAQLHVACEMSAAKHPDLCVFGSIPVSVRNAGNATSDFVALVFVAGEFGPQPYPLKQLAAYTRFRDVAPGESRDAMLDITLGNLARVDASGNTVLYPGKYKLLLDVPTKDELEFELQGAEGILEVWPQPGN